MALYHTLAEARSQLGQVPEIRLVLGDQLHAGHSWWQQQSPCLYVLQEVRAEATYVRHHQQKILAIFAAMRAFARAISQHHDVLYLSLDAPDNQHDLASNATAIARQLGSTRIRYQEPDEYRVDQALQALTRHRALQVEMVSSEHFYTERDDLASYFPAGKSLRMETFYRQIRRETGILMTGDQPVGGQWNFDHDNRNRLPQDQAIPKPKIFHNKVPELVQLLRDQNIPTIGHCADDTLLWPINRRQSRELLNHFVTECLPWFGTYQDALTQRHWSLFHARLSFSLNTKMLSPREVVQAALARWEAEPEQISLAQIEGFVRQLIGWREYVRLIYWDQMPTYATHNRLDQHRSLPDFYWTGDTRMACLAHTIQQSLNYGYAHHIQRLMVTGNFALLAGVHPDAVDAWYLGIYVDAFEWVELPNTRGMSQYADGGLLATKPYASSGNYLKKMGDYCQQCYYQVSQRTGDKACPFNSLYWHFIDRQQEQLATNHRMGMIIRQWQKKPADQRQALLDQANTYLADLDNL